MLQREFKLNKAILLHKLLRGIDLIFFFFLLSIPRTCEFVKCLPGKYFTHLTLLHFKIFIAEAVFVKRLTKDLVFGNASSI